MMYPKKAKDTEAERQNVLIRSELMIRTEGDVVGASREIDLL